MNPADQQDFTIATANLAHLLFGDRLYTHYRTFHAVIQLPLFPHLYTSHEEWEKLRLDVSNIPRGALPTLRIFQYFMRWLNSLNRLFEHHEPPNTTTLTISQPCGHAVHPATVDHFTHEVPCPVCTIEQSTSGLARAWRAWQEAGGPDRREPCGTSGVANWAYNQLTEIWKFEKIHWAKLILLLEHYSEKEAVWEAELSEKKDAHALHVLQELIHVKSATKALEYAKANDPHRTESTDIPFVPRKPLNRPAYVRGSTSDRSSDEHARRVSSELYADAESSQTSPRSSPLYPQQSSESEQRQMSPQRRHASMSPSRSPTLVLSSPHDSISKQKKVTWAESLPDNSKRPLNNFWRKNAVAYSPGRHACPSEDGWEDTSFMTDNEFVYDIENYISEDSADDGDVDDEYEEDYDGDDDDTDVEDDQDEYDQGEIDDSSGNQSGAPSITQLIGVDTLYPGAIHQSIETGIDITQELSVEETIQDHAEENVETFLAHEFSAILVDNGVIEATMGSSESAFHTGGITSNLEPAAASDTNTPFRYVTLTAPFPHRTNNSSSSPGLSKRSAVALDEDDSPDSNSSKKRKTTTAFH